MSEEVVKGRVLPVFMLVLLLLAPALALADGPVVSISVTPSGDGVLTVPVGGDAAFAVAVGNFGAADVSIIATTQATPSSQFSGSIFVCPTNAQGQCLFDAPVAPTLRPGDVVTYSVFVHANAPVAFDPRNNRIVMTFSAFALVPGNIQVIRVLAPYSLTSVAFRTP